MSILAKKQSERIWDPFAESKELSEQLNRAFGNGSLFGRGSEDLALPNVDWTPSVNMSETDEAYMIRSSYGHFMRRFSLPSDADDTAIEATHKDGGLSIRIPKTKTKAPAGRQIKVS